MLTFSSRLSFSDVLRWILDGRFCSSCLFTTSPYDGTSLQEERSSQHIDVKMSSGPREVKVCPTKWVPAEEALISVNLYPTQ